MSTLEVLHSGTGCASEESGSYMQSAGTGARNRLRLPAENDNSAEVDIAGLGQRLSLHRLVARFVLLDVTVLLALGLFSLSLRFYPTEFRPYEALGRIEAPGVLLGLGLFLTFQQLMRGYRPSVIVSASQSLPRLMLSLLGMFSLLMALAAATKTTGTYSRSWFFVWAASSSVMLPILRALLIERTRHAFAKGAHVYRALSVGIQVEPLGQADIAHLTNGLSRIDPPLRIGSFEDVGWIAARVQREHIDDVYLTVPWAMAPTVFSRLRQLQHLSINVHVLPVDASLDGCLVGAKLRKHRVQIQMIGRAIEGWALAQKRFLDVSVAALGLLLFAPIMLMVAAAIRLESKGPILFRQPRLGFNGRKFELFKFRSMYAELADLGADRQTSRNDTRVTPIGRFIRRTSIDELPQLFNVIRGDMSIVGPRPHALSTKAEGQELDKAVSDYALRHRVRPGMTGWAQVNGLRGELDSIEKLANRVRFDMEYIENWSLALDLKIIARTCLIVLHDPKAY